MNFGREKLPLLTAVVRACFLTDALSSFVCFRVYSAFSPSGNLHCTVFPLEGAESGGREAV